MEALRSRGELLGNEDSLINAELIDHLTEAIFENVFVGKMFEMHRNIAINKLVGLREELVFDQTRNEMDNRERKADNNEAASQCGVNPKGTSQRGKRSNGRNRGGAECKCKCFVCHQMIAAVRFAPHLEKCIGIGRAARSRRRGANSGSSTFMSAVGTFGGDAELSSPSRSTRSSTLRSASRRNMLTIGDGGVCGGGAAATAIAAASEDVPSLSLPGAPLLGRRRPLLVAEDFTLHPGTTTIMATKAMARTICTTDVLQQQQNVLIKDEENDATVAVEEPLRERLRNKNVLFKKG